MVLLDQIMKEFLIGLTLIIAILIIAGIGFILMPFFIVLTFALRILLSVILIIFSIWLLGKCVVIVWEKIKTSDTE